MKQDARRRKKGRKGRIFDESMEREIARIVREKSRARLFDSLFEETGDRDWLYRSKLLQGFYQTGGSGWI